MKVYTTESAPVEAIAPVEVVEPEAPQVDAPAETPAPAPAVPAASDEDAPLAHKGNGAFFDIVEEL